MHVFPKPPLPSSSAAHHRKGRRLSSYLYTLLAFILFFTILYSEEFTFIFAISTQSDAYQSFLPTTNKKGEGRMPFALGEAERGCDVFNGRWVWDDRRPLYEESDCPYLPPQMTCQKHGRPDRDYLHWRWQPHGCSLPSFNATVMLENLRDKRIMFVGDSLGRGHLISLACLLQTVIPEHAKYANITYDFFNLFRAKDYNATFEFYWAPYLLSSSSDNAIRHTIHDRQLVRQGSINEQGQHWKGVDILVFNNYNWWAMKPNFSMLRESSSDEERGDIVEVPLDEAYRMALQSMVGWIEENMDPNTTRVFFTNMSPKHGKSIDWGGDEKGNCYNETTLIEDPNYRTSDYQKFMVKVVEEVLRKSKYPITSLNITQLSSYRKDAHTSIYKKRWKPLTPEQMADPVSYADCLHWCLPGLQETWNELLFAKLFYP